MEQDHLPTKNGKILHLMGSLYESMTPSSQRIVEFIKANPADVTKSSIADLSQQIKVGEATIIRFCRLLGFKGFQDFKMELAVEVSYLNQLDKSILNTDIHSDDPIELVGLKLKNNIQAVLEESLNLLNFDTLKAVAESIKKKQRIYFFGVGSSGLTAEEAKNKFMRIGFNVDALTNNHFMYMKASLLQKGNLVFGISHSGGSIETIKGLKIAKEAGATTVALTHNPKSALCQYADWVLLNGSQQGPLQGDLLDTKIAQLYVLDLLYVLLVMKNPSSAIENKLKTTKALMLS